MKCKFTALDAEEQRLKDVKARKERSLLFI